jgi:hypothetical protein
MAGGPGGCQRHRQRHRWADASVAEQVVELQDRRRCDQYRHRPTPSDQQQAGDRKPEQIGERVGAPSGLGCHADRDQDRDRDHQRQAHVQKWPGDALHPLPHRRHALVWKGHAGVTCWNVVLAMPLGGRVSSNTDDMARRA